MNEGLLKQINDENWFKALKSASDMAELSVKDEPLRRFDRWGVDLGPEAQDMISGVTKIDPAARLTIEQVLAHPWWREDS